MGKMAPSFTVVKPSQLLPAVCLIGMACSFSPSASPPGGGGLYGSGGSAPIPGLNSLTISPTSAHLTVVSGGPVQTQQFKVTGTINGVSRDLTTEVFYSTAPAGVVAVDSSGLASTTGSAGGVVTITATSGSVSATATLTVNYTFVGADPGMTSAVPSNAPTLFTSTRIDSGRAPQFIYPNDGVLFPPNVSGIEIHFTPGANNTLFEVNLIGPLTTIKTYIRCTAPTGINGCIYLPDPGLWSSFAQGNAGQGQVALIIRGTDDQGPPSEPARSFHLQFSKDDIKGALYYWTTSGKTAIMRWDFGGSTKTAAST